MAELPHTLPREWAEKFTADPARWLMRARSPVVRYRAAVDLLGWPAEAPKAAALWEVRHTDADVAAVTAAQGDDGLWRAPAAFYLRQESVFTPRYLASVWQLPLWADFGFTLAEPAVARAAEAFLACRTADGSFEMPPPRLSVAGTAFAVSALAALGVPRAELAGACAWLAARQRPDGGWAEPLEIAGEGAPSPVGTTAEVVRALAGEEQTAAAGRRYLLGCLFTDYNGRFAASDRPWYRLSWPQYRYDALSVATALVAAGASREEVAPLAEAVRALQTRRGFWRQQVPFGEQCWITPVRAGRASRWVTYKATSFLLWYYGRERERDCEVK
ncbi:MAG: terpene cyclase/mutase family protein [Candidatus Coatesbacteria bacterium]|nr:MAG: terpene cyclase/mutase family protein [Candidatus Coatesbacteria bacterium]